MVICGLRILRLLGMQKPPKPFRIPAIGRYQARSHQRIRYVRLYGYCEAVSRLGSACGGCRGSGRANWTIRAHGRPGPGNRGRHGRRGIFRGAGGHLVTDCPSGVGPGRTAGPTLSSDSGKQSRPVKNRHTNYCVSTTLGPTVGPRDTRLYSDIEIWCHMLHWSQHMPHCVHFAAF